jgi:hypothetical protein
MRGSFSFKYSLIILGLLLSATFLRAQCGVPPFTGPQTSANIAAYMTGPYRTWCLAHGGTIKPDGNCNMSGPNWKCDPGGASTNVQTLPLVKPGRGSTNALAPQVAATATQQMVGSVVGSMLSGIFSPKSSAPDPQQQMLIQQQQQQAAAEQKAAEDAHRQQIADDLSGKLKLSDGSSDLQFKTSQQDSGSGDLQLKLGDNPAATASQGSAQNSAQTPNAGIALREPTGPGLVPAQTTTTADVAGNPDSGNSAPASALSQLKQIQANSQAAANATSMEAMKEQAGAGWDGGSLHPGSAVSLPNGNGTVTIPKQGATSSGTAHAGTPAPVQLAGLAGSAPVLATGSAARAPGAPIFKPEISATVQAMSNEQLQAEYCHVQGMVKQLHEGFLKESGAFDGWQKQVGDTKRAEYEESRKCFFDELAEGLADAAGEKLIHFSDWMLNDLLKQGWTDLDEIKENAELITTMKSTAEDVQEAVEKYGKSEKSSFDRGMLSARLLQDFYSVADKLPGVKFHGTEMTGLAVCMANYMVTSAEQRLLNEELSQANKSVEDQLRAENALSRFSGELVDAQLIRGLHPATACR